MSTAWPRLRAAATDKPLFVWSESFEEIKQRYSEKARSDCELSLHELIESLKLNPKNVDLSSVNWEDIVSDISCIHVRCKELMKVGAAEIGGMYLAEKQSFLECLSKTSYKSMREYQGKLFVESIAMICCAISFHQSYLPRNNQLLAVLLSLQTGKYKGTLLEVSTGQGKTIIVMMLALLRAMAGRSVDVLTSSRVLAKRDAHTARPVCEIFGFYVDDNGHDDNALRAECYKRAIVYGEVGDFQRDYLLDRFHGLSVRGDRKYEAAIIDEVDSMFLDKGDSMLYLSQAIPGMEMLEGIFVSIWIAVNGPNMGHGALKSDIADVKKYIENSIADGEITFPAFLADFVDSRIETWIESAIFAKGGLNKDDAYLLSATRQGVVIMDKNTGVQLKSTHLSDGVQQFLQLKHLQRFKPETLKSVFVSSTKYFKMYELLSGLSGTLGSDAECNLLSQVYNIAVTFVPNFKSCQRVPEPGILCADAEKVGKAVLERAQEITMSGRPVLVINNSISEVMALAALFNKNGVQCKTYATDDDHFHETASPGDIILSTNLAGRGTDIKISAAMERAGGLHVILTFVPENLRIERQAFGRAGRQGQRGSGQFIIASALAGEVGAMTVLDKLQFNRDAQERQRLYRLSAYRLLQIELEESLLDAFYDKVISSTSISEKFIMEKFQDSSRERFAFWLDTQKLAIQRCKQGGQDVEIRASFYNLVVECNQTDGDDLKRFKNLYHLLQIGKYYLTQKKRPELAKKTFEFVLKLEPDFCEMADYYLSAAVVGISEENHEDAYKAMVRARYRLMKRIEVMSNYGAIMEQVRKCTIDSGTGIQSDLYAKQVEGKMSVLQGLVLSIDVAVGVLQNDLSNVASTLLTKEMQAKVVNKLRKSKLFLPLARISEFDEKEVGDTKKCIVSRIRTTEYSIAIKEKIASIVVKDGAVLKASSFADLVPHSDDLLERLCLSNIIELDDLEFQSLNTLLFQPLTDFLAAEDVADGEIVYCRHDQTRWTLYPQPLDTISQVPSVHSRYKLSRPQTVDPSKFVTCHFSYIPHPLEGGKRLHFEGVRASMNSIDTSSFLLMQSHQSDLAKWKGLCLKVERQEDAVEQVGTCLGVAVSQVDGVDHFVMQVQWTELINDGQSNCIAAATGDLTWKVVAGGVLTEMRVGKVPLESIEWKEQTRYQILRSAEAATAIDSFFDNEAVRERYPRVDGLKAYLKEHAKPCEMPVVFLMKESVQLHAKEQACDKLLQQLHDYMILQSGLLDPSLADNCTKKQSCEKRIQQLKLDANIADDDTKEEACDKLLQQLRYSSINLSAVQSVLFDISSNEIEQAFDKLILQLKLDAKLNDDDTKEDACNKLVQQLRCCLLSSSLPRCARSYEQARIQRIILNAILAHRDSKTGARRKIVLECLRDIPEKIRSKVCDDIMVTVEQAFSSSRGSLQNSYTGGSDGTLACTTSPLYDDLQDKFNFTLRSELLDMAHLGIDSVVKFQNKPFWWGPLLVILLGVAQIVLGACLSALGMPNLGAAFISEGVGDITYGLEAYISGSFSFKAYLSHKMISVGFAILTCGVGGVLNRGVSVAHKGVNSVVKKVCKKVLQSAVNALSGFFIDTIMDAVVHGVVQKVLEQYATYLQPTFSKVKDLLVTLLQKTSERDVKIFMQKMNSECFKVQDILNKVRQYTNQVLQAVASGIGNAVKGRKTHMAEFAELQAALSLFQKMLRAASIGESIFKACKEMAQFVWIAQYKVECEIKKVDDNRPPSTTPNRTPTAADTVFIDEKIAEWDKMVKERMTGHIYNGILKPEIKQTVNGFLRDVGNTIKNTVFPKDLLADHTLQQSLTEARQINMQNLASKDAAFCGENKSRTSTQLMSDKRLGMEPFDPPDDFLCANTDGYTVKDIKEKLPGAVFYKVGGPGNSRIVFLPPKLFESCVGSKVVELYYQAHHPELCLHEGVDSELVDNKDGTGTAHRYALVNGKRIDIKPLSTGGNFCDEQVRLFNSKLREQGKQPDGTYSKEEIDVAMSFARDARNVYDLRKKLLPAAVDISRALGDRADLQVGVKPVYQYALAPMQHGFERHECKSIEYLRERNIPYSTTFSERTGMEIAMSAVPHRVRTENNGREVHHVIHEPVEFRAVIDGREVAIGTTRTSTVVVDTNNGTVVTAYPTFDKEDTSRTTITNSYSFYIPK